MGINWKEYKRLLKKQKLKEAEDSFCMYTDKRCSNLAYLARKDVEAFEDKKMLPKMNKNTFGYCQAVSAMKLAYKEEGKK